MALPGTSEEKEIKLLLTKLLKSKDEVYKFAMAASAPREGRLLLDKKQKFKKKDVLEGLEEEAEEDADPKKKGTKPPKLEVMTGECHLDATNAATLRLTVYGKAPAKAVACFEHLLVKGPYKTVGFVGVIVAEVEENESDDPQAAPPADAATTATPPDPQAQWEQALADIEPAYLRGLRDRPEAASQLRGVLGFAQGKAEKKEYPAAIAALRKLAEILTDKPAAAASENQVTPPATVGGDQAALWKQKVTAWGPAIKAAIAAKTTHSADLMKLLAQANALSKPGGDMTQALAKLTECHELAAAAAPSLDSAKTLWEQQFAELEPRYLAVLRGNPAEASKLRVLMTYATEQAEAGQYEKSLAALKRLVPLLGIPTAASATVPETADSATAVGSDTATADNSDTAPVAPPLPQSMVDERRVAWQQRFDAASDSLKRLRKEATESLDDIQILLDESRQSSESGDYASATQKLDQLEPLLRDRRNEATERVLQSLPDLAAPQVSTMRLSKARVEWVNTISRVRGEIGKLQSEMKKFEEGELGGELTAVVDLMNNGLIEKLDQAMNAEGELRQRHNSDALKLIKEFHAYVNGDPLLAVIDRSPLLQVDLRGAMRQGLMEIAKGLTAESQVVAPTSA